MNPLASLLRRSLKEYEPVRAPALPSALSQCRVHEVAWEGPGPCWCCADGIAEVGRG